MSKMPCLMTRFECQHLKGFQTLLKSVPQYFYTMCSSLLSYFSYKKFFFVIFEILRPFFNLLILDDKYSLGNRENLLQPIQMQLSKKRQIFSRFFTAFLKCRFDFEHFAKKDDPDSLCISEIIDWEICGNCPWSRISEQPRIVNILTCPKHWWNLCGTSFLILFQHS